MSIPNTHFGAEKIGAMLTEPRTIFFAGVGGVSMSTLAHISFLRGHRVIGYDRTPSAITKQLEDMGIDVRYESCAENVRGADLLVYTVAIPAELPEYAEARRRGIPTVSRADYLGYVMTGYETRLGVCGTHGKSTTTAMLERVFRLAGRNPTVSCGAPMKDADGRCDVIGGDRDFIFEACEYMDSFLDFYPTQVVALNLEEDHLDYFHNLGEIEVSFGKFMERTGKDGIVYLNACDGNLREAAKDYPGRIVSFGVGDKAADYRADDVAFTHGRAAFTVYHGQEALCRIALQVPGEHNVTDALAAAAAALENGIAPEVVAEALGGFTGASRRMDFRGVTRGGAEVYDDYAHHPTEILSTVRAAAGTEPKRLFVVFQPHTFTRTKELFAHFAQVLADPAIRCVSLAEIYPARETDSLEMSSSLLAEAIRKAGGRAEAYPSFEAIALALRSECREGDMILVMGAGDITNLCPLLTEK